MRIYTFPQALNPRKIAIYLAEKQLDVETVATSVPGGRHRSRDYIAKNPMAAVPVLELDDGRTLSEPDAIIEYLEELHPEPPLLGADPWSRAIARELTAIAERGLVEAALMALEHSSPEYAAQVEQSPAILGAARARFAQVVGLFDTLLGHHEWLAGDAFTVADITAFVAVEHGEDAGCVVPETATRLLAWRARVRARPSVQRASA